MGKGLRNLKPRTFEGKHDLGITIGHEHIFNGTVTKNIDSSNFGIRLQLSVCT